MNVDDAGRISYGHHFILHHMLHHGAYVEEENGKPRLEAHHALRVPVYQYFSLVSLPVVSVVKHILFKSTDFKNTSETVSILPGIMIFISGLLLYSPSYYLKRG